MAETLILYLFSTAIISSTVVWGLMMLWQKKQRELYTLRLQSLQERYSDEVRIQTEHLERQRQQLQEFQEKVDHLQQQNLQLAQANGTYQGQQQELQTLLAELKNKVQRIQDLEINLATLSRERDLLRQEQQDWQMEKQRTLESISEGILAKTDQRSQDITSKLLSSVEKITGKVQSLTDDLQKNTAETHKVSELLLHPTGARNVAEITLENLLRDAGLRLKESPEATGDFLLQAYLKQETAENVARRYFPDALVFLPEERFLLIDSKSSKAFLEFYQQTDGSQEQLQQQLFDSFKKHLNDLSTKNYPQILRENLSKQYAKRTINTAQITTCLFVQTDSMLETLQRLCPELFWEAKEKHLLIVGPTSLMYLLEVASHSILLQRQAENLQDIKEEVRRLLNNTSNLVEAFISFGDNFKGAIRNYNKIANNLNSHFATRIKRIAQFGIILDENKKKLRSIPQLNLLENNQEIVEEEIFTVKQDQEIVADEICELSTDSETSDAMTTTETPVEARATAQETAIFTSTLTYNSVTED